ncbi:unnamed protein product [Schistocephalus solidus]|uniref:Reverse transcriptase domain-containing protein n=1 Tax=Schistocephalus solidus TaxID=70667 RepID=A0A183SKY1_SCHSO|nr:unnamed protein product [Schistocephalus solidus]
MVRPLQDGMMVRVTEKGTVSETFAVTNGVKQFFVLAPTLFSLMLSAMLMDVYLDERPGIRVTYRKDGHLLNSRRMQASTRVSTATAHDLLFVDHCALNTVVERTCEGAWTYSSPAASILYLQSVQPKLWSCTNRLPARNTMLPESMSTSLN